MEYIDIYIDILVSFPYVLVQCNCEADFCTRICRNCAAGASDYRMSGGFQRLTVDIEYFFGITRVTPPVARYQTT